MTTNSMNNTNAFNGWKDEMPEVVREVIDRLEEQRDAGGTVVCVVHRVCEDVEEYVRAEGLAGDACEDGALPFGGEEGAPEETLDMGSFDVRNPAQLGQLGEELAARYMESRGYVIEARNYRTPYGEADIICRNGDETVLVEVKTRLGAHACPEEAVTDEKIKRYRNITIDYLARRAATPCVRFDVIALNVVGPHTARVHHFVGVCSWEG